MAKTVNRTHIYAGFPGFSVDSRMVNPNSDLCQHCGRTCAQCRSWFTYPCLEGSLEEFRALNAAQNDASPTT